MMSVIMPSAPIVVEVTIWVAVQSCQNDVCAIYTVAVNIGDVWCSEW
jgi:hypothetical protein